MDGVGQGTVWSASGPLNLTPLLFTETVLGYLILPITKLNHATRPLGLTTRVCFRRILSSHIFIPIQNTPAYTAGKMAANCTNVTAGGAGAPADADTSAATAVAIICVIISSISTTFGLFFQKIAQDRGGICGNPFHAQLDAAKEDLESFLEHDGADDPKNAALKAELEEKVASESRRESRQVRISVAYWFGGFSLITLISFVLDLYSMAALGQSLVVPLLAGLEVRRTISLHHACCTRTSTKSMTIRPQQLFS